VPTDAISLMRAFSLDQHRRRLQTATIQTRRYLLAHLADWLGERSLLEATTEDVERFLDSRRLSDRARYNYISHLHTFYAWTTYAGHLEHVPTAPIHRPRLEATMPRPIGDADLDFALAMSRGDLRVIVALGAFAGFRCIEISRLCREDVVDERERPFVIARGKGGRNRIVPLHDRVKDALADLPMPSSGPVLVDGDGRPWPAWKVSHIGNAYLHGIGIGATMHQLRHWFGTNLYQTSEKDLLLVRDVMGHRRVTTTTVYADFDRRGAAAAVAALEVRRALGDTG
jgi:integrase/recombinase XerC